MTTLPRIGELVPIYNASTNQVTHYSKVLSISPTGKRVTVTHPTYVGGKAIFYQRNGMYRESYGGVSHLNDYFRT